MLGGIKSAPTVAAVAAAIHSRRLAMMTSPLLIRRRSIRGARLSSTGGVDACATAR